MNDFLQDMVNKSYDELLDMARGGLQVIVPKLQARVDDEDMPAQLLIMLMFTALAADGKASDLEAKFISDLFPGTSYSAAKEATSAHYGEKMAELTDKFVDACNDDPELRAALITFTCIFLAVDETISRDEVAFLKRLMA